MRTHQWGIALALVARVLWAEYVHYNPNTWMMVEAFETKRECEAVKARQDKIRESYEAAHLKLGRTPSSVMKADYSCWPDPLTRERNNHTPGEQGRIGGMDDTTGDDPALCMGIVA
jgi:hypothetical protein